MKGININQLRKELSSSPKKLELLNEIYLQIVKNHYCKEMTIKLPAHMKYSSKLKKSIVTLLGYSIKRKKISNEFEIYRDDD